MSSAKIVSTSDEIKVKKSFSLLKILAILFFIKGILIRKIYMMQRCIFDQD